MQVIIKMDLTEIVLELIDWIYLVHGREWWWAFVKTSFQSYQAYEFRVSLVRHCMGTEITQ
jgi:hypothetical protein